MGLKSCYLTLDPHDGQTPLEEEEKEALRIKIISTQGELNEFEQKNIESALMWLNNKKLSFEQAVSFKFIQELHYKMFKDVWSWAGKFRKSNKNIGVDKTIISVEIKKLLDDCSYWKAKHAFSPEEIAIRFKHRLVLIHPFSNGNGRHSRLMADVLVEKVFKRSVFGWGGDENKEDLRRQYLRALRKADEGDYNDLIVFAKLNK